MKKLYLAGPHGFSEIGDYGIQPLKNILKRMFELLDPFDYGPNQELGIKLKKLNNKLYNSEISNLNITFTQIIHQMEEINREIAKNNENLLRSADKVLGILDGPDVDSGTAAEIGMAYILGKEIYGYRGDLRSTGDNLASMVNLQVEYCIYQSKGRIFHSLKEVAKWTDDTQINDSINGLRRN